MNETDFTTEALRTLRRQSEEAPEKAIEIGATLDRSVLSTVQSLAVGVVQAEILAGEKFRGVHDLSRV